MYCKPPFTLARPLGWDIDHARLDLAYGKALGQQIDVPLSIQLLESP
jgi:hypothetical protein